MNIVIWIVAGAVAGFLASVRNGGGAPRVIAVNVITGIVGAVATGWLLSGLFATSPADDGGFSVPEALVTFVGASLLLPLVNTVRDVMS